jgi:hypothetical protein
MESVKLFMAANGGMPHAREAAGTGDTPAGAQCQRGVCAATALRRFHVMSEALEGLSVQKWQKGNTPYSEIQSSFFVEFCGRLEFGQKVSSD